MSVGVRPGSPFGEWLSKKINQSNVSVCQLGEDIHKASSVIYRHIKGLKNPTFASVVTYCWYFNELLFEKNDPIEVYYKYVERG